MTTTVRPKGTRSRLPRPVQGMALGALLTVPFAAPALAGESSDPFAAFPLIRHEQMAELRGGFNVGGLELEFGANVRTLIDNVVRLETIVQLTKAGLISSNRDLVDAAANTRGSQLAQVAQDTAGLVKGIVEGAVHGGETRPASSAAVATAGKAQASAAGSGRQLVSIDIANRLAGLRNLANRIGTEASSAEGATASATATQPGAATTPAVSRLGGGPKLDLSGLGEEIRGVVLSDTKGLTASIQELTRNRISNTIINQANDRHIDIEMNIQVDVKNFSQFSESLRNGFLNQRLANQNF